VIAEPPACEGGDLLQRARLLEQVAERDDHCPEAFYFWHRVFTLSAA
jgi:hypothetical protein